MSKRNPGEERPKVHVLVVDDHPIVRERLAELIDQEPDLRVCGEAEDTRQALKMAESLRPDFAIVDVMLKGSYGIELIKRLKELQPELPILVLSMHDESLYGERALRAGARGYLTKQQATKEVVGAIRTILAGGIYASAALTSTILHKVAHGAAPTGGSPTDVLTERELDVFRLLGRGLGVKQIADNLFVSVKTIEAHREHIKRKLKFKTSGELLGYAIDLTMRQDGRRRRDPHASPP